jgi:hypothetical protein
MITNSGKWRTAVSTDSYLAKQGMALVGYLRITIKSTVYKTVKYIQILIDLSDLSE